MYKKWPSVFLTNARNGVRDYLDEYDGGTRDGPSEFPLGLKTYHK